MCHICSRIECTNSIIEPTSEQASLTVNYAKLIPLDMKHFNINTFFTVNLRI